MKKTIPTLFKLFMFSGFIMLFAACSDDDDNSYPSVVTELVDAVTNADKAIAYIKRDNGELFYMKDQRIGASAADSTYRCLSMYEVLKDENGKTTQYAKVYQLKNIFSSFPVAADRLKSHEHSPVQVYSTWPSDRYFNMYFGYLTTGVASHPFAFSIDSTSVSATTGKRIMHVSLIHQRPPTDPESYTQKSYLSLPLYTLKDEADSLVFHVNTYNGEKRYGIDINS